MKRTNQTRTRRPGFTRACFVAAALSPFLGAPLLTERAFAQEVPSPDAPAEPASELDALREEVKQLNERLKAVEEKEPTAEEPATPPPSAEKGKGDLAEVAPVASSSVTFRRGTKDEGGGFVLEFADDMKLRFGGQVRWRGEYRGDLYSQPKANSSSDFVVQRIRLTFAYDLSAHLGAKVTVQDSRLWGDKLDGLAGARLNSDQPELMLYEGYASLRNPFNVPLEVRVGRMAVPNLGDQRLISDLDWSHIGRAFDGGRVIFKPQGWWLTAFAANVREGAALPIPGDENDDVWLFGAYVSNRMIADHEFDAFLYVRRVGDNKLGALTTDHTGDRGARKDYTAGMRFKGAAGPLVYNGMFAYQFGQVAGDTIHAWASAIELGVVLKFGDQKLKISTEGAWSSGDPNPNDGRIETFDPLLPFAHFYNGHQDLFAWRNLYSTNLKLAFWPAKGLGFHVDTHAFWLQRRDDNWYGLGFARADTTSASSSSRVGTEVDVYCKWDVWEGRLQFWGGYSHFFPGKYIRQTGPKTSDQSWAFLMATVNF